MRIFTVFLILVLAGCTAVQDMAQDNETVALKKASFADLPGWGSDDFKTFIPAFKKSGDRIL